RIRPSLQAIFSEEAAPPPEEYTVTLSASPQTVNHGDKVTLQATLNQNGLPVANKYVSIEYKNPADPTFAPLVGIGPTDNNGTASYEQLVNASWFRESTCQLKAIYLDAESDILTLALEETSPPPVPSWQAAALAAGVIGTGVAGVVIIKRRK
ncbi:unnamed protein product, partial [marine sediment metagenome]